jgi:hypothetical protein
MKLRIEQYGQGLDLYIAEISRKQLHQMEKSCAFFGNFYWKRSLQNLWYLQEARMMELFGVSSFRQMKSANHRYLGPLLRRKSDLDAFLGNIEVQVDDSSIEIDASQIQTRFKPVPVLPVLTDTNVVVFHGEHYQGTTAWDIAAVPPFRLKHMRLNFIDCGDNGFVLQSVSYGDKKVLGREEAQSRSFLKLQFAMK